MTKKYKFLCTKEVVMDGSQRVLFKAGDLYDARHRGFETEYPFTIIDKHGTERIISLKFLERYFAI